MSREALALDISRVVSRVVSGEPVDTAERGASLAAKYPDLGMSGQMIHEAIDRAAGMVGMIRTAPAPADWTPPRFDDSRGDYNAANGAHQSQATGAASGAVPGRTGAGNSALPVAKHSIDDDLASAIDAEIGSLVSGQTRSAAPATTNGAAHQAAAEAKGGSRFGSGAVAAFRRALFRN